MQTNSADKHIIQALNNFEEYVKKNDLIPVEYKLFAEEQVLGVWVPRKSTNSQIKKVIKRQVEQHGGRWLGKYTLPDPEEMMQMIKKTIDEKVDKDKVKEAMGVIENDSN